MADEWMVTLSIETKHQCNISDCPAQPHRVAPEGALAALQGALPTHNSDNRLGFTQMGRVRGVNAGK